VRGRERVLVLVLVLLRLVVAEEKRREVRLGG
jgi:hypothetical protein